MAEIFRAGEFMTPGEEKTAEVLLRELPKGWAIICNKQLIDPRNKSHEIDFILIGKHAIYILDEKGYSGKIDGTTDYWIFESGESIHSPFYKIDINAKMLAGILRKNFPKISAL